MTTPEQGQDIRDIAQQFSTEPVTSVTPVTDGSINQTYEVETENAGRSILQGMSEIFTPVVLDNLIAVEPILREAGVLVPACRPTVSGELFVDDGHRWYRSLTYIPGITIHDSVDPDAAMRAGALISRFHSALADADITIEKPIPHFHDTEYHIGRLQEVMKEYEGTKKDAVLSEFGREILARYEALDHAAGELPTRIIHGDLKISNIRFDEQMEAIALIDMDTLMPGTIEIEMGDALRSWCGIKGEDSSEQVFDRDVYEAAMDGYKKYAAGISEAEIESIPSGIRLLTLELASRFLADAYEEKYFAQSSKYPNLYEQNRTRAENQLRFLDAFESKIALPGK